MSVQTCDNGDGTCFLYCSTSGRPVNLESFDDAEAADSFLAYVGADVRAVSPTRLEQLHTEWLALPKCQQCGERVVNPGELPNECESCRPECEEDGCDYRGEVMVEMAGGRTLSEWVGLYCHAHAAAIRETCTDCGNRGAHKKTCQESGAEIR